MFRHLIILIITFIVGSNALSGRIINGGDDSIEHRPYMVALEYIGVHKCGGSIISKNFVLTAGHCMHWSYQLNFLTVRSGSSFKERGGSISNIKEYFRPLDFLGVKRSDICLLKLMQPLVFGSTRQPIKLFGANEKVEPGVNAIVSGWGKTKITNWNNQLQSVMVPIVADDDCHEAYKDVNPGQFCAGYYGKGGKDSCQGDSGGPLVVDGRQIGIVSWGFGCAEPLHPGIYTEIAYYRDWIAKYVS